MTAPRTSTTDSPWFWIGLFVWAAILGLLAIGPKYAARQQGLERRQDGRETGWRNRVADGAASEASADEAAANESGPALARRMLLPLFGALSLVLIAATWAILIRRVKARVAAPPDSAQSAPQTGTPP